MDFALDFLDTYAARWALWMVHMSWQVAILGGIIWLMVRGSRRSPAALRYALWLLVFVKLVLPPWIAAPWSAGTVAAHVAPSAARMLAASDTVTTLPDAPPALSFAPDSASGPYREAVTPPASTLNPATILMLVWGPVAAGALAVMLAQYIGYARRVTRRLVFAPEPVQRLFTAQLEALGMPNTILLRMSPDVERPGVFGSWHPMVLLPEGFETRFSPGALAGVLGHELAHIKRRDLLAGWIVAAIGCIYWFHPIVWLAIFSLRREREMACDDIVLESTRQKGRDYAAAIVDVAEALDGAVPAGAGFLGVVELASSLTHRVRSAVDSGRPRRTEWTAALWIALVALLFVPMGVWSLPVAAHDGVPKAVQAPRERPRVAVSTPKRGATDVDPALNEIRVTFNQDMDSRGYSWTGGGEVYPKSSGRPYWLDRRTCVLPVSLEKGNFYRVGINSTTHQNFASRAGEPALPDVIYFTTKGANEKTLDRLKTPKVASLSPMNGAKGVAPGRAQITVAFDRPMDPGYSWVGQGPNLPEFIGDPKWSKDRRTCSLSAQLKPNWYYSFGLNSRYHINFQSESGVPLKPLVWDFHTGE